jgi:SAM-dependent methyltransferase
MRKLTPELREAHNETQRRYFANAEKSGMRPTGTPYLHRQLDELVRFARLEPGQRVLEVGCGMGRYTLLLAERGIRVEGIDLSAPLLDRLRAFNDGRFEIPLYTGDVLDPPEPLGVFDAVVGFFTLHHVHDLPATYRAMAGLVAPGGPVAFLEPNPWNPLYYVQIAVKREMTWEGDRGLLEMRRSTVFPAMASAGLADLRLERFGFFPPFAANAAWGPRVERVLERRRVFGPVLPFQLFGGVRPAA